MHRPLHSALTCGKLPPGRCALPRSPALALREHRLPSAESIRTWLALRAVALHLECAALGASRVTKDLNPYVEARREWNDRYLDLVRARRWWQITAVAELALVGVRGRGLDGTLLGKSTWEAVLAVETVAPTTADVIQANPFGLYVTEIRWTKQL